MISRDTPFGRLRYLAPAAKLTATPGGWDLPTPLPDQDQPTWLAGPDLAGQLATGLGCIQDLRAAGYLRPPAARAQSRRTHSNRSPRMSAACSWPPWAPTKRPWGMPSQSSSGP